MTKKFYGRSFLLEIGNDKETLVVDSLRVKFSIKRGAKSKPDTATFQVYNLSEENRRRVTYDYNQVRLSLGYGELAVVYHGEIIGSSVKDATSDGDIILEISAGDGLTDYSKSTVNVTLAAGANDEEIVRQCLLNMKKTEATYVEQFTDKKLTRGSVLFGRCRAKLSVAAANQGRAWRIQDNGLVMVGDANVIGDQIYLLSQETGMLGKPEVTEDGIIVRSLIIPAIGNGSWVAIQSVTMPDINGEAKVLYNELEGDTMGDKWEMKLTCVNGRFSPVKPEKFIKFPKAKKKSNAS